jgi:hypothetical protein
VRPAIVSVRPLAWLSLVIERRQLGLRSGSERTGLATPRSSLMRVPQLAELGGEIIAALVCSCIARLADFVEDELKAIRPVQNDPVETPPKPYIS